MVNPSTWMASSTAASPHPLAMVMWSFPVEMTVVAVEVAPFTGGVVIPSSMADVSTATWIPIKGLNNKV